MIMAHGASGVTLPHRTVAGISPAGSRDALKQGTKPDLPDRKLAGSTPGATARPSWPQLRAPDWPSFFDMRKSPDSSVFTQAAPLSQMSLSAERTLSLQWFN